MPYAEPHGKGWRVRWWAGDKYASGRKKYESESGFDTEQQALDYGYDQESDLRNGRYVSRGDGKILFKDWVALWVGSLDLDPTSIQSYRKCLRARILPHWGETPVRDITTIAYRAWEKRIRAEVSDNYAKQIFQVFRMLMDDAVAHRPPLIADTPVPKTNRRRGRYVRPEREEKETVLPADIDQLAENARTVWGLTGYAFIYTKAYTGMRLGEMFGLRREYVQPSWPEAEPERILRKKALARYCGERPLPVLRVRWQHKYVRDPLQPDEQGVPTLAPPKYSSVRTLVIPPFLQQLLDDVLASHDSEWVFPSLEGGPLLTTDFNTYYWKPIRDGAEARTGRYARPAIPPVEVFTGKRIHLVRHAHKAWMDEDGHPRVAVEERLGHRLQGVEGVYADVTPEMERRMVESLQRRWESLGDRRLVVSQKSPDHG